GAEVADAAFARHRREDPSRHRGMARDRMAGGIPPPTRRLARDGAAGVGADSWGSRAWDWGYRRARLWGDAEHSRDRPSGGEGTPPARGLPGHWAVPVREKPDVVGRRDSDGRDRPVAPVAVRAGAGGDTLRGFPPSDRVR